ncbi:MAG: site-2 protease family protein [Oscillibacter sp.]|jgi:Zn-dependent protease|uniref:site-2 protease family protein n=1 Tax=uncultured Oscillibacter sp. TaxID=876091 RepID=UPI0021742256|nr:site-2 protease family protein [uncultured Oscillibacter sp.]MCI9643722.1 site-2 protease family protein [Oscillibacter sp.]
MDFGGLIRSIDWNWLETTLARVLAVLLCLTVHEACHGLAAYALGDPTARDRHRLSLNPLRHIDWLGLAMMLAVGFGWAKPVPVDPRYFKRPKQGMALTALAGPVSNLLLALLAVFLSRELYARGAWMPMGIRVSLFQFLLYTLAPLSIGLGLFNLLPIPPLDGSKVLGAFLPDRAFFGLMRYERYGMFLLLALSWFGVTGDLISGAIMKTYEGFFQLFY